MWLNNNRRFGDPAMLSAFRGSSIAQQLKLLRERLETADTYIVSGDSTRDNTYNEMISYYTRMLGKAGITVFDNAHSGQSGADWSSNFDVSNVNEAIAAISGTGATSVLEFSFGINDVDSSGSQTPEELLGLMSSGLDALIAAKPDLMIFFVQPVAVASVPRNDALNAFYDLLVSTYGKHLVKLYQPMRDVWDGDTLPTTDRVFYEDGTHPNSNGSIRAANYIFSEVLPDSLLETVLLDNLHWTGSGEAIVSTETNITNSYWNSSGGRSINTSWKSFDLVPVTNGQVLRITHMGSRDDVRLLDSSMVLIGTLTVPDLGSAGGTYEYNINLATVAYAGCNITSTNEVAGAFAKVEVVEIVAGQGAGDLTQAQINAGFNSRLRF